MAAPLGNQNAAKAKVWTAAVERALSARSALDRKDALEACANALIDKALEGDMTALKELGDRLEGKPAQAVSLSGPNGGDIPVSVAVRFVKPDGGN
jgi:hypothetical protein